MECVGRMSCAPQAPGVQGERAAWAWGLGRLLSVPFSGSGHLEAACTVGRLRTRGFFRGQWVLAHALESAISAGSYVLRAWYRVRGIRLQNAILPPSRRSILGRLRISGEYILSLLDITSRAFSNSAYLCVSKTDSPSRPIKAVGLTATVLSRLRVHCIRMSTTYYSVNCQQSHKSCPL